MTPKYPKVKVVLYGEDSNGFMIVGRVSKALRKAGVSDRAIAAYRSEATSGNYDHLIQVTMDTVTVV